MHFNIRLEGGRQCILVLMGATAEGKKELIAIADGYRESEQSWKELLLDCKARGLEIEPTPGDRRRGVGVLEGDASGLGHDEGAAVLGAQDGERPGQAAQGGAAEGQGGCCTRSTRPRRKAEAEKAFDLFVETYEAKYPKATECLVKDREVLLAFYDFPAEHWVHIRTTNPIESVFATVRLRHDKTKGSGSRAACLTMVFKLMESASKSWRSLNGSPLLAEVVKGTVFIDGIREKPAA